MNEESNMKKSVEDVKALLEKTKDGKPYSTIDNAAIIFREDPLFTGTIKLNLFRERIELNGKIPWIRVSKDINDMDDIHIRHYVEITYHMTNDKKIREGMQIVASENSFHPVREYLNSLCWDGKERIRHVLHHFLGTDETDYSYECMKLFLLGAINRVFYPGCKFEYMLCLIGGQGIGKSSFIRFLACFDEWFCDDIKKLDDERIYEHLAGHWIVEIVEMVALNNVKCKEATKAFLSRQYDNFRLPYGIRAEDRPRQCVFAGTSNVVHFLPDDRSGNRRFLPILCDADKAETHILENEQESRKYMEQVWAEAMELFKSNKYILRLPKDMEKDLISYQGPFMQEDSWDDLIKSFLADYTGNIVCCQMLYREALDIMTIRYPDFEEFYSICEGMHITESRANEIKTTLNKIWEYGKSIGLVEINYSKEFYLTDFKFIPKKKKPIKNASERERLIAYYLSLDTVYGYACALMECLNLRICEVKALKWSDIYLEDGLIYVNYMVNYEGKYCEYTKNEEEEGAHFVPISPRAMQILEIIKSKNYGFKDDFVFLGKTGNYLLTGEVNKNIHRACKALGIVKNFTTHDCRRYAATNAALEGMSTPAMQMAFGWKDRETAEKYIQVAAATKEHQQMLVKVLN